MDRERDSTQLLDKTLPTRYRTPPCHTISFAVCVRRRARPTAKGVANIYHSVKSTFAVRLVGGVYKVLTRRSSQSSEAEFPILVCACAHISPCNANARCRIAEDVSPSTYELCSILWWRKAAWILAARAV